VIAASLHTKLYLAKDATDMRKGFPGLIALTEAVLRQEPGSGHRFVFLNIIGDDSRHATDDPNMDARRRQ
jgi:hypothetical protein